MTEDPRLSRPPLEPRVEERGAVEHGVEGQPERPRLRERVSVRA